MDHSSVSPDRSSGQIYPYEVLPDLWNSPNCLCEMIEEKKKMYVLFAVRSRQISSFGLEAKLSKLHDKERRIDFEDSGLLRYDAVHEVFSGCVILKIKVL